MLPPRLACLAAVVAALWLSAAGCGSADDQRPQTWSFISATIIEPSCATVNCHSKITHQGGVDLSSAAAGYAALVSNPSGPTFYVYPSYPQYSSLVTLLNATGSTRMPPDNPLPQADIQLIENWISSGAKNN
ncbi:MAG TPA: hypothetical protein VHO06_06610 [Polyangia bacterium]|nr:hypothetical protein [Polyangia bacterium]